MKKQFTLIELLVIVYMMIKRLSRVGMNKIPKFLISPEFSHYEITYFCYFIIAYSKKNATLTTIRIFFLTRRIDI